MNKKAARLRRARKTRFKLNELKVDRIVVYRTSCHIYAQIISVEGKVKVVASSLDKEFKTTLPYGGNVKAAKEVGKLLAERAKKADLSGALAFDRSGFKYHGRIKALADAAREGGLNF